jgi:hypothetical protein
LGPGILLYFWRLKKEMVGPLSENKISVAAFLLEVKVRRETTNSTAK